MSDVKAVVEAVCVEVAKLQLGPNDVLVLRVSRTWSMNQVEHASEALKGALQAADVREFSEPGLAYGENLGVGLTWSQAVILST